MQFSPSSIDQYAQVAEMLSSLGFPELLEKFKSVMFKVCYSVMKVLVKYKLASYPGQF